MSEINELLKKKNYKFEDLISIMSILRSDSGCPWDKEQTHKSIRNNIIEEVYEFIEGIDTGNKELMCEELGDVLLQIVFHSQIASEENKFNINDVCNGICKKLISRHPHIFSDITVKDSQQVLENWDDIKMAEKGNKTITEEMGRISKSLPSLIYASKLQGKAAKVGFDFANAKDALKKIIEETNEVKEELIKNEKGKIADEIGDLLFATVNVARLSGIDAEEALYNANEKFYRRFLALEEEAGKQKLKISELSLEEMDQIWNKVKTNC